MPASEIDEDEWRRIVAEWQRVIAEQGRINDQRAAELREQARAAAEFWRGEPDRVFLGYGGAVVIEAARDPWLRDVELFIIGDVHKAYEWSMALADRHPRSALWHAGPATGVDDEGRSDLRRRAISLRAESRAIFEAIVAAYRSGRIQPVPVGWQENQPADETLLVFRRDDILAVIAELGAEGDAIRWLMLARERQQAEEVASPGAGETGKPLTQTAGPIRASRRGDSELAETPAAKTVTKGKRGRKSGSGAIDDSDTLLRMLRRLEDETSPSVFAAAGVFANGNTSTQRRLHKKFSAKWGTDPPAGKTWSDVLRRVLNTN